MEDNTNDSPAVQFLQMMWRHVQGATSHSWLKLNHAMADALRLAIKGGMRFNVDDFEEIAKRFRSGYWIGDGESFYSLAVLYRNSSAYLAYESANRRKPFIVKSASIAVNTGDGPAGNGLARLIIGARFKWAGEDVRVTSFNDQRQTLTACSYKQDGKRELCAKCSRVTSWPREVIKSRYTISHADIKRSKQAFTEPAPGHAEGA